MTSGHRHPQRHLLLWACCCMNCSPAIRHSVKWRCSEHKLEEICRRIREVDAPKPSHRVSTLKGADRSTVARRIHIEPKQLVHELRGELDWIVLKALEKDRSRRYASAAALSDDIQRYLRDEPVAAAAPGPAYVLREYRAPSPRYWRPLPPLSCCC